MNTESFKLFAVLLFLPIVITFQIFIGYIFASVRKMKESNSTFQTFFKYWLIGLGLCAILAGVYFLIIKFVFRQ